MATYKEISGFNIKSLATDPSNLLKGEIWYNSTSGTLKVSPLVGTWVSGNNLNTARYGGASSGIETAALLSGGNAWSSGDSPTDATEEFDGSTWTTSPGSLNTARYAQGAFGIQTSSVITGGDNRPPGSAQQTTTETYDGSTWTAGTAYPVAITNTSGFGTTAAGVIAGGATGPSPTGTTTTTDYASGTWTAGGVLPLLRRWSGTAGTQTAGLIFLGQTPPNVMANTDSYNGTAWTAEPSASTARTGWYGGNMGSGTQTATMMAGGWTPFTPSPTATELYNGTNWSTGPTLASGAEYNSGGGSTTAGITTGGFVPGVAVTNSTQTFTAVTTAETITTS